MTTFAGIVIDGPYAGQRMEHRSPCIQVPEFSPIPLGVSTLSDVAAEKEIGRVYTYVHDTLRLSDCWFCFWRLSDDTTATALAKLSEGYTQNCSRLSGDDVSADSVEFATRCFVRKYIGERFLNGVPSSQTEHLISGRMTQFRSLVRTALEAVWP